MPIARLSWRPVFVRLSHPAPFGTHLAIARCSPAFPDRLRIGDVPYPRYKRRGVRAWRNGRRTGLKRTLSARRETADVELLKFGETFTGNPEPSPAMGRCRD